MKRSLTVTALLMALGAAGCIELTGMLQSAMPGSDGGGATSTGPSGSTGGDADPSPPVVMLSVSNTGPLVGEEVELTCSVVAGTTTDLTFDFQPADPRLLVQNRTGVATFIVEEPDVGSELAFTCRATNAAGTSQPSAEVVIIPSPS